MYRIVYLAVRRSTPDPPNLRHLCSISCLGLGSPASVHTYDGRPRGPDRACNRIRIRIRVCFCICSRQNIQQRNRRSV